MSTPKQDQLKHTPGPWMAHQGWADTSLNLTDEYPHWCEVTGPEGPTGCPLSINGHFGIANARLIAAAPELFDALKRIVDESRVFCSESMDIDDGAVDKAIAAINKAEGRE